MWNAQVRKSAETVGLLVLAAQLAKAAAVRGLLGRKVQREVLLYCAEEALRDCLDSGIKEDWGKHLQSSLVRRRLRRSQEGQKFESAHKAWKAASDEVEEEMSSLLHQLKVASLATLSQEDHVPESS